MRLLTVLLGAAAALAAADGVLLLDDRFRDANSQNQDLRNNSVWLFNGRTNTVRTDAPGSVTFDLTNAGGSEGFWAFFTDAGQPVNLSPGDKLTVAVTFTLSGFQNNGQDIRWGVLDSKGTRNNTNLAGGMNDATFIGDTGYGLDFYASGAGSPFVLGRRTVLSNANVFNNFADFASLNGSGAANRQPLADNIPYTLTYTIERLTAIDTRLTASVTGGALDSLTYTATETSTTPSTTFDYFAFRVTGPGFATKIAFSELAVSYAPAAPQITIQPQPPSLTLQVGGTANLSIAATGSALTYQWTRDGAPLASGNGSATTPNLVLSAVQLTDAGVYRCAVSNSSATVTSDPVTLNVQTGPVPPPPSITQQPASSIVTVGGNAILSVTASGDGLYHQWFRNGTPMPGATTSQLTFAPAQVTDSADYYAVVSNSSGSVTTRTATLLIASPMKVLSFSPAKDASGLCNDTPLTIQFDRPVKTGVYGRVNIWNSAGAVVDSIDAAASPQTRRIGGVSYAYYPILINGSTATIYPHQPLNFNETYEVTVDPWVFNDLNDAPYAGFNDDRTWKFTIRGTPPPPASRTLRVAADGSGDYCTVQAAVDAAPANATSPFTIAVQPGTYTEMVYIPSNKPFLTIRGANRDTTVIQYPDNNNLNPNNSRALLGIDASDFTLEDITIWNTTPRGGSQAEAIRANNQRILLNRINARSFQDTVWLQGSVAVLNSYIEGDVDFMWGYGGVYFRNDELRGVNSGGYYTQIRNDTGAPGNVYVNCKLTAPDGVTGMYLARIDPNVFPYSQVVYINTQMGPHIAPAGWLLNNATTAPSAAFWEYNSTDPAGQPVDVSQRLGVSRQLTADEAAKWSDPAIVLGGWVPSTVNASHEPDGAVRVDWTGAGGGTVGLYKAGGATLMFEQAIGEDSPAGTVRFPPVSAASDLEIRLVTRKGTARTAVIQSAHRP